MTKVMYKVDYNDVMVSYRVEKETSQQTTTIIVYEIRMNKEDRILRQFSYSTEIPKYDSPFLSWYNLIFCSNNCGPAPDYNYMTTAVQCGKKTAATVYLDPKTPSGKKLLKSLPDDCSAKPYDGYIYVYHKGCLSDYFNYEVIKDIYEKHCNQSFDWLLVKDLFDTPLSFFGDPQKCGFHLHDGDDREQRIILGLLLGYPVESTVEYINGNYFM